MTDNAPDLVILGNNARPAACAALRLGWQPWCMDTAFTLDLLTLVPGTLHCPTGQYPQGFANFLLTVPEGTPWLYTNALDRYASFVGELTQMRPLLGNGVNSLITAHAPFELDRVLRANECRSLELQHHDGERPDYHRWVLHDVSHWRGFGTAFAESVVDESLKPRYYRQHIEGRPIAGTFVGDGKKCQLIGVTDLLIGTHALHAPEFRYAGEVGPITLPEANRAALVHVAEVLTERAALRGVFTLDGLLQDGHFWLVQAHPCFTESVEVLELATGWRSLVAHGEAFGWHKEPKEIRDAKAPVVARGVVHAQRRLVVPEAVQNFNALERIRLLENPEWADVPRPGEVIEAGWPLLTVFGYGATADEALAAMHQRAEYVLARFVAEPERPRPINWYDLIDDGNV